MTDQLHALLERTADEWCADAVPPPLSMDAPSSPRSHPRLHRLAPVLAAAAVVAVVTPIALIARHAPADRRTSFATVGSPVTIDPRAHFQPDDAGLPAARRPAFARRHNDPACTAAGVTAVVDLSAARVKIDHTTEGGRSGACLLPEDLRLDAATLKVAMLRQPDVTNPPDFDGRVLIGSGIEMNAVWSGDCADLPAEVTLSGTGLEPLTALVRGTPTTCGTGTPRLTVGPAHAAENPGAIVPSDRAGLRITLDAPDEIGSDADFTYRVTVANPTGEAISLRPCPTYANALVSPQGFGNGSAGRVPCDQLPARLEPQQQVVLVMPETSNTAASPDDESEGAATITWQVAGADAGTTSVNVVRHPPKALPAIPYAEPSGPAPSASDFTYHSTGAFPVVIQGPTTIRAGETLHYRAVFTNPEGRPAVPLRPCPGWTETFVVAPKVSHNPTPSVRHGAVNCAQAPDEIAPNETITFEMELVIPSDTAPGPYQLFWQLHRGMDSGPFDLQVTR